MEYLNKQIKIRNPPKPIFFYIPALMDTGNKLDCVIKKKMKTYDVNRNLRARDTTQLQLPWCLAMLFWWRLTTMCAPTHLGFVVFSMAFLTQGNQHMNNISHNSALLYLYVDFKHWWQPRMEAGKKCEIKTTQIKCSASASVFRVCVEVKVRKALG